METLVIRDASAAIRPSREMESDVGAVKGTGLGPPPTSSNLDIASLCLVSIRGKTKPAQIAGRRGAVRDEW
jgi:hypothetical protein